MALALNNAQGELHPLEVGLHALRSGLEIREYAKRAGIAENTLGDRVKAARVAEVVTDIRDGDRWSQLASIHAAPRWLWHALVSAMLDKDWSVEQTRAVVKRVKDAGTPPEWADAEAIADAVATEACQDRCRVRTRSYGW